MLTVGIVGLPNVGKSTLFNGLTVGHANVSNYPFTTIDSNVGMAAVPDARLEELARVIEPAEVTACAIEFFDIAGLVEGASRGEGLGNQFLGAIRSVDAIVHVVRCFADADVSHVLAEIDPVRDARLIESELMLADLEVLAKAIEKRRRAWKADPRKFLAEEERLDRYRELLEEGRPLRSRDPDSAERQEFKSLGLLTGKPMLYVANLDEGVDLTPEPSCLSQLRELGAFPGSMDSAVVVPISAKIEWELAQLDADERAEFMSELGLEGSGLERLVAAAFSHLGLIRFYTLANDKLRAWEIERGTPAQQAAGKVHSDMERGFVRARVASWDEIVASGSFHRLHELGKLRTEGKSYEVRDGDVVEFLFTP